jgi:hypothetical protein
MNLNLRYSMLAVVVGVVLVLVLITLTEEVYAVPQCNTTVCRPECYPKPCLYWCGENLVLTTCELWCSGMACE